MDLYHRTFLFTDLRCILSTKNHQLALAVVATGSWGHDETMCVCVSGEGGLGWLGGGEELPCSWILSTVLCRGCFPSWTLPYFVVLSSDFRSVLFRVRAEQAESRNNENQRFSDRYICFVIIRLFVRQTYVLWHVSSTKYLLYTVYSDSGKLSV